MATQDKYLITGKHPGGALWPEEFVSLDEARRSFDETKNDPKEVKLYLWKLLDYRESKGS